MEQMIKYKQGKNPCSRNGFKKGHLVSKELRLKVSLFFKGKPLSEEHKKKISLSNKGKIAWNKGKICPEETKQKISLANKGRKGNLWSEEHKKKISLFYKGKHISLDTEFKNGHNLGKNNFFVFKGDNAGKNAFHRWIKKYKYNFGFCETCGKIANRLNLANIKNHQYTRNFDDYQWLCCSCHNKLDNKVRNFKR